MNETQIERFNKLTFEYKTIKYLPGVLSLTYTQPTVSGRSTSPQAIDIHGFYYSDDVNPVEANHFLRLLVEGTLTKCEGNERILVPAIDVIADNELRHCLIRRCMLDNKTVITEMAETIKHLHSYVYSLLNLGNSSSIKVGPYTVDENSINVVHEDVPQNPPVEKSATNNAFGIPYDDLGPLTDIINTQTAQKGLKRMCGVEGGLRRGEMVCFGALQHNFTSGMLSGYNDVIRGCHKVARAMIDIHNIQSDRVNVRYVLGKNTYMIVTRDALSVNYDDITFKVLP